MSIEYANVPVSLGIPFSSRAVLFKTPPLKTSLMGYAEPSSERRDVDIKGSDFAPQTLL